MDYEIFRRNLTNIIESRYGSTEAFSRKVDMKPSAISRYCTTKQPIDISASKLVKFADEAGVSIDWLLGRNSFSGFDGDINQICSLYAIADDSDKSIIRSILSKYEKKG